MKHGVNWKHVTGTAIGVFTVVYVVLRLITSRGAGAPRNTWIGVAVLLVIAGLVLAAGWPIRRYLKGHVEVIPDPHRARRTVVAAQASALAGGAMTGWYLAQAAIHARSLDLTRSRDAFILALVLAASAVGMAIAGLIVQGWCTIDDSDDDKPSGSGAAGQTG